MKYDYLTKNIENSFYGVSSEEVIQAERKLEVNFPLELKKFYSEVGYGFIKGSEYNINRIMDPFSIRDFRLRVNDFKNYPDIETFDEVEYDRLAFFEANESVMILIGITSDSVSPIYLYDVKIADSLAEFFRKITRNDMYYMNLV